MYSPTYPFFFLLSEHKYCDNAATNSNSENARSRMVASLRGSVGTGTNDDESSKYWARLSRWISPCYGPFSLGALFETYEPFISLIFQILFFGQWPTADTESVDMAVHLYICLVFTKVCRNLTLYTRKHMTMNIDWIYVELKMQLMLKWKTRRWKMPEVPPRVMHKLFSFLVPLRLPTNSSALSLYFASYTWTLRLHFTRV